MSDPPAAQYRAELASGKKFAAEKKSTAGKSQEKNTAVQGKDEDVHSGQVNSQAPTASPNITQFPANPSSAQEHDTQPRQMPFLEKGMQLSEAIDRVMEVMEADLRQEQKNRDENVKKRLDQARQDHEEQLAQARRDHQDHRKRLARACQRYKKLLAQAHKETQEARKKCSELDTLNKSLEARLAQISDLSSESTNNSGRAAALGEKRLPTDSLEFTNVKRARPSHDPDTPLPTNLPGPVQDDPANMLRQMLGREPKVADKRNGKLVEDLTKHRLQAKLPKLANIGNSGTPRSFADVWDHDTFCRVRKGEGDSDSDPEYIRDAFLEAKGIILPYFHPEEDDDSS